MKQLRLGFILALTAIVSAALFNSDAIAAEVALYVAKAIDPMTALLFVFFTPSIATMVYALVAIVLIVMLVRGVKRLRRAHVAVFLMLCLPSMATLHAGEVAKAGKIRRAVWDITERGWRTNGVSETYAAQIEEAWESATPAADRRAMREATDRAWATIFRADWAQIHHDIGDLRCASGLGSPECRASLLGCQTGTP